ncbi:MAG: Ig-like domain-containing protein [Anaerolineales bacterium]
MTCNLPGDGGWCRGGADLHLEASDPQGLGVAIQGELNGSPFQCEATCSLDLPEGQGTASFEAVSDSGRTASGTATWQLDSVPPVIVSQLQGGTLGNNGWYTAGPVDLACTATDVTSGVAVIQYSVDGGLWGDAAIAQADGPHTLECLATDGAGNTSQAQKEVKIDSSPPTTVFDVTPNTWLAGTVTISGRTVGAVSGLADVDFALDSTSDWISLGSASGWTYSWDTRGSSDGGHRLYARGEDVAGNVETPQSVQVRVDNTPPQISLQSSWVLGQAGKFSAEDSGVGIGNVKAVFSGNGIDPREVDYTQAPGEIAWDGIDGSGGHVGNGTYQVVVTACDLLQNCATAQAQILDPAPPPPNPTRPRPYPTLTATPTPTSTPMPTLAATPTGATMVALSARPARPAGVVRSGQTAAAKVAVKALPSPPEHWIIWPFVGMLGLITAVGTAYAVDGRPKELRALRRSLELIFLTNFENQFEAITKGER